MKPVIFTAAVVIACATAACASRPFPAARVASTEAALRTANEIGAENVPAAAMHLRMAEDQVSQARRLIADEDYSKAEWVLAKGESDAEAAVALTREARQKAATESSLAQLHAISPQQ